MKAVLCEMAVVATKSGEHARFRTPSSHHVYVGLHMAIHEADHDLPIEALGLIPLGV
jgi:hypothetical protein